MGNLVKGENWWWGQLKESLFCKHDSVRGSVVLCHGRHEVEVHIDHRHINIKKVYLSVEDTGCPICHGEVSMAGSVKKNHNTFVLYADIKSNAAIVHWIAEY